MHIDTLAYRLRSHAPQLYRCIESGAARLTQLRYGRAIRNARLSSKVEGTVGGSQAVIEALLPSDVGSLAAFFRSIPHGSLTFFRPHGTDEQSLNQVLARGDYVTYGLWIDGALAAYALLKLFVIGKGYVGLLVQPRYEGLGLGKFLYQYLCWQADVIGVSPHATIHRDNVASMKAAGSVRGMEIVGDAGNGYYFVRYPTAGRDRRPPPLDN